MIDKFNSVLLEIFLMKIDIIFGNSFYAKLKDIYYQDSNSMTEKYYRRLTNGEL